MKHLKMKVGKVPIQKLTIEVSVKFTWLFRLRMWLGLTAIRFVAFVWDCEVMFKENTEGEKTLTVLSEHER